MDLHGELKVNGHIIGDWSAVRKEAVVQSEAGLRHNGPKYRYACAMTLNGEIMCGEVSHYFNDGAVVLLKKVCQMHGWAGEV